LTPGPAPTRDFEATWSEPTGFWGWLRTVNNVPIAKRYLVAAFTFFLAGGVQALVLRLQLLGPERHLVSPERYNQLFTMHGTTMMFLFVIPFIEALANFVLPLMLGTRDLPFPRLTALSFWTYVLGGVFLYTSFWVGAAPDGGWFAYAPMTSERVYSPGLGIDFWDLGLSVAEVAALAAAAELIVAILRMRAVGMTLSRLPLFAWAMLVTALMIIFAFTPLIVGTAMLELDRKGLTRFFDARSGGAPLLWQHLFWMFGHPEVYIMFLPAVGIVCHVVQTFARRPIVSYRAMVLAMLGIGLVSFGLWAHHMLTTGLSTGAATFFAIASLGIAIPSAVQLAVWLATLWWGRPVWRVPLLFVAGFLQVFTLGGLTGVVVALVPVNWQLHDSYFIVAHFHYVLIGGVLFPLFAGIYYWFPKLTGRHLGERLGRWHFWTMLAAFNVTFFPLHGAGLLGMPRRVASYPPGLGWETFNLVASAGAVALGASVAIFLVNALWSLARGTRTGPDPWGGDTLEWCEPSPAPQAQFATVPVVTSRYPLWEQRSLAPEAAGLAALLAGVHHRPVGWRGALVVSVREARPLALVHLPGPTLAPLAVSLGLVGLFAGALVDRMDVIALGAAVTGAGLVGWFWPRGSEGRALGECRDARLPLAVAGPASNGWWGTWVLMLVLGVALASLVGSYWYLGAATALASRWPSRPAPAAAVTLLLAAAVAAPVWAARPHRGVRPRRLGLAASLLAHAAAVGLLGHDLSGRDLAPWMDAAASIVLTLGGFQAAVGGVALAMLAVACLWALARPDDPRGRAPLLNGALVSAFAGASWVVVGATVYLSPHLP
jgi:cytochrome c oxidase subunit I+III